MHTKAVCAESAHANCESIHPSIPSSPKIPLNSAESSIADTLRILSFLRSTLIAAANAPSFHPSILSKKLAAEIVASSFESPASWCGVLRSLGSSIHVS